MVSLKPSTLLSHCRISFQVFIIKLQYKSVGLAWDTDCLVLLREHTWCLAKQKGTARQKTAFLHSETSRLMKHKPQVHRVEPTNIRKADSVHLEHRSHSQYLLFQTRPGRLCHHSWKHGQFSTKNTFLLSPFPPPYSISYFLSKSFA